MEWPLGSRTRRTRLALSSLALLKSCQILHIPFKNNNTSAECDVKNNAGRVSYTAYTDSQNSAVLEVIRCFMQAEFFLLSVSPATVRDAVLP